MKKLLAVTKQQTNEELFHLQRRKAITDIILQSKRDELLYKLITNTNRIFNKQIRDLRKVDFNTVDDMETYVKTYVDDIFNSENESRQFLNTPYKDLSDEHADMIKHLLELTIYQNIESEGIN